MGCGWVGRRERSRFTWGSKEVEYGCVGLVDKEGELKGSV